MIEWDIERIWYHLGFIGMCLKMDDSGWFSQTYAIWRDKPTCPRIGWRIWLKNLEGKMCGMLQCTKLWNLWYNRDKNLFCSQWSADTADKSRKKQNKAILDPKKTIKTTLTTRIISFPIGQCDVFSNGKSSIVNFSLELSRYISHVQVSKLLQKLPRTGENENATI